MNIRYFRSSFVLIFALYGLLALLLLNDLWRTTVLPGAKYEGALSFFAVWWPWQAITENYDLVSHAYVLYPNDVNWFNWLSLPSSALFSLADIALPSLTAYTLLYPLYLSLGGAMAYGYWRAAGMVHGLAVLAGLVFAFNPVTYTLVSGGQVAWLGVFLIPLWLGLWDAYLRRPGLKRLVRVVLVLYALILMSPAWWNLILTWLLPYGVWRWWVTRETRVAAHSDGVLFGVILLAVFIGIFPLAALLNSTTTGRYPTPMPSLEMTLEQSAVLWGMMLVALLAVALWRPARDISPRQFWAGLVVLNAACWLVVGIRPLHIVNAWLVPDALPDVGGAILFLYPVVFGILSLALMAPQGLARLSLVIVMGAGLIGWLGGVPTQSLSHTDALASLAAEPEPYVVVVAPLATTDATQTTSFGIPWQAGMALAQVPLHHKRLAGGLVPALSPDYLTAYTTHPVWAYLGFRAVPGVDTPAGVARAWQTYVPRERIGYVMLDTTAAESWALDSLRGMLAWSGMFCHVDTLPPLEMWRARWHPAGCPDYRLSLGGPESSLATGEGWYAPESWGERAVRWAGPAQSATLTLWAVQPTDDLRLGLIINATPDIPDQSVSVSINGERRETLSLQTDWTTYYVLVPRELALQDDGQLTVTLTHEQTRSIQGRQLHAVYDDVWLETRSPDGP
ncbi:MAG: hypothetical protein ACLFTK_11275 [Anaerolineales bacterium]